MNSRFMKVAFLAWGDMKVAFLNPEFMKVAFLNLRTGTTGSRAAEQPSAEQPEG